MTRPLRGGIEADDALDQDGLARAGWPENGQVVAPVHRKGDAAQGEVAQLDVQVRNFKEAHRGTSVFSKMKMAMKETATSTRPLVRAMPMLP